jgi:RNA polymerase sigma factor (sigma-70 family)
MSQAEAPTQEVVLMSIRSSGLGPGQMQALFRGGAVAGLTDVELLDRFVASRGEVAEIAFAALVDRHGPMVLGVCRRIIADRHAADDAFQATFLILARRAGSVRVEGTLGRWLYGVSRRVALRERAILASRPEPAGASSEGWGAPADVTSLSELRDALDEEVAWLPRRSREVIVFCHFEGLSFGDAAARIGCPVGTVGSRLTRARALLRSRLARRGFGPAAILAASAQARAEVPQALARATARLASAGPAGAIPAAVAALCIHTTRKMTMTMIASKMAAAATLIAGILAAGAIQQPDSRPAPTAPPLVPKASVSTPAQDYDRLVRECVQIVERESDLRQKGGPVWDAYIRDHMVHFQDKFAPRFLELARSHPGDPIAFDALLWVAVFDFTTDLAEQAATLLARDHSRDPRLWPACQEMTRNPICPAQGILLRAILKDQPDRAIRGRAGLALVAYLLNQEEFVRMAKIPGLPPYQARFFSSERMDQFRKLDPDALRRDADETCERVLRDYSDVRPVNLVRSPDLNFDARTIYRSVQDAEAGQGTLGDLARARLDEIRSLAIGKPAPEIEGLNDQGKPMRLGDFRGKVVLLTFSGNWCGPCVSMYPDERELVKRFEGRPFAMLSVNSDKAREELLKSVEAGTITWRCWWEPRGDEVGPIAQKWHVRGWPTIFVIDHRGIIRIKSLGTLGHEGQFVTGVGDAVEAMLKEAEKAAR